MCVEGRFSGYTHLKKWVKRFFCEEGRFSGYIYLKTMETDCCVEGGGGGGGVEERVSGYTHTENNSTHTVVWKEGFQCFAVSNVLLINCTVATIVSK